MTSLVESPKLTPRKFVAGKVVVVVDEVVVGLGCSWIIMQPEKMIAIPAIARIINKKISLISQSLHLDLAWCKPFISSNQEGVRGVKKGVEGKRGLKALRAWVIYFFLPFPLILFWYRSSSLSITLSLFFWISDRQYGQKTLPL